MKQEVDFKRQVQHALDLVHSFRSVDLSLPPEIKEILESREKCPTLYSPKKIFRALMKVRDQWKAGCLTGNSWNALIGPECLESRDEWRDHCLCFDSDLISLNEYTLLVGGENSCTSCPGGDQEMSVHQFLTLRQKSLSEQLDKKMTETITRRRYILRFLDAELEKLLPLDSSQNKSRKRKKTTSTSTSKEVDKEVFSDIGQL